MTRLPGTTTGARRGGRRVRGGVVGRCDGDAGRAPDQELAAPASFFFVLEEPVASRLVAVSLGALDDEDPESPVDDDDVVGSDGDRFPDFDDDRLSVL
ncbi:MAG: hypothetical protein ACKOA9_02635 [Actinomycetota bacterium]